MLLPVRCITCGRVLGNLGKRYVEGLQRVGTARAAEVLDQLGLTRMCCRSVMTTHVDVCERILDYDRANSVRNRMDTSHERVKITRRSETDPLPSPAQRVIAHGDTEGREWTRAVYDGIVSSAGDWDEWMGPRDSDAETIARIAQPENLLAILHGVYGTHMNTMDSSVNVVESGWDDIETEAALYLPYDPFNPSM
jgi:DNA-directed RNA polymerase I, II, and III subunit RPABC5